MDNLTKKRIIELYEEGKGINVISKIFKIKKAEINKVIKDVERVGQSIKMNNEVATTIVEDKGNTIGIPLEYKYSLDFLHQNINLFQKIIEQFASNNLESKNRIEIQLPLENDSNYKTSIRVNKVVMEQFREFCNKHKEFTGKDLLSMALVEFMSRHK